MVKKNILILVESPNKVASIKSLLKGTEYDGAVVKASVGHITEIRDNKSSYKNTGIHPQEKFKTDFAISPDKKKVAAELTAAVAKADIVYLCSDPDREGEAISWALKKFLKIPDSKYKRATFHEITKTTILNGLNNPRKIDENLVDAAHARAILDKLVGYSLSPVAREHVNCRSVGRCQSPGLKLIVEREKEINNFIPEKYYDLYLHFEKNKTAFKAKYFGTTNKEIKKIKTLDEIEKIKNSCSGDYIIDKIESKDIKDSPKPPFTTSTFQQEANKKLGLSVEVATKCAQKLFEGISIMGEHVGLITYIRTDDSSMSPEFAETLGHFVKDNYGNQYYAPVKQGKGAEVGQCGHECLRVTNLSMTPDELNSYITDKNLLRVYKLIWLRTVQSSMAPAIIGDTQYNIINNNQVFTIHSKEVKFDGYRKVLMDEENEISDDEIVKETFKKGEKLEKTVLKEEEKATTPPKRYTEASFLKELDKKGIGRPSTFPTIIKTLLDNNRGYCSIESKLIHPTDKGMALSAFLDNSFSDIINLEYTSNLESNLDKIAQGELNYLDFLNDFFVNLENSIKKVGGIERICPECGGQLVKRKGKYGYFLGCQNYPNCRHIENL